MLKVTHSLPDNCPGCGSTKLEEGKSAGMETNSRICHGCGVFMITPDPCTNKENQLTEALVNANLVSCPHCKSVGQIEEAGGEEWCSNCSLDPNVKSYPASQISHLWKSGSDFRKCLDRDIKTLQPGRRMGDFAREFCGPHCEYAKVCPQTVKNFVKCFREENEASMNRGIADKKEGKEKPANPFGKGKPRQSVLICAKSGWLEERMYDRLTYNKQFRVTGSGSGA